jgi:hypothetical protein
MVDYNQFNKISSNIIGALFSTLGIAGFAMSGVLYMNPIQEPDAKLHMQETLSECLEIAKSNSGFTGKVDMGAKQVSIQKYGLVDGKTELLTAENIIARCNNVEVVKFCIGDKNNDVKNAKHGCSMKGLQMTLKYSEPWKYTQPLK